MALIEGIGDEVIYCAAVLLLFLVLMFAWLSTRVGEAMTPSVWLVQLQTWPQRRVLQVISIDPSENANAGASLSPAAAPQSISTVSASSSLDESIQSQSNIDAQSPSAVESSDEADLVADSSEPATSQSESLAQPQIRLKFLDETQKLVAAWLTETVGQFKRQHFGSEVAQGHVIRLIYNGQLLRDDERSLQSYGVHDGSVVHCHISQTPFGTSQRISSPADRPRRDEPHSGNRRAQPMNPGQHFSLLVGLPFALMWCAWLRWSHFFDFTALFSLIVCTVVYLTFLYASAAATRRRQAILAGDAPPRPAN